MNNYKDTGIALTFFNRPKHSYRLLETLKKLKINELFIFMDGINQKDPNFIQNSASQLKIIEMINQVKWAKIKFIKRKKNLGLKNSIIDAVDYTLSIKKNIILLEDDCIPTKEFFDFTLGALNKYKKKKKIMSIAGYQFPEISKTNDKISSIFSKRFIPWGWATWKDRWKNFNPDLLYLYNYVLKTGKLKNLPNDIQNYLKILNDKKNLNDVWSINWVLEHYISNKYCLFPSMQLIENIGFDSSGVHCTSNIKEFSGLKKTKNKSLTINLMDDIKIDVFYEKKINSIMEKSWIKTLTAT